MHAVQCINWWPEKSRNVIKCVKAFKIDIKIINVVQIGYKENKYI